MDRPFERTSGGEMRLIWRGDSGQFSEDQNFEKRRDRMAERGYPGCVAYGSDAAVAVSKAGQINRGRG